MTLLSPLSLPAGLLEIRAVAMRTVAIKGVQSSRYLCMDEAGRLHGQVSTGLLAPGVFCSGTAACSNSELTKLSSLPPPPPPCSP